MMRLRTMRSTFVVLLMSGFLLVALTACSSSESAIDTDGGEVSAVERPAWDLGDEMYLLRLAPELGAAYHTTHTQNNDMNMSVMGNDIEVVQSQTTTHRMDISDYTAEGVSTIEYTILRMQSDVQSMGQEMSYDSDAEDTDNMLAEQFGPMIGATLHFKVDQRGNFVGERDSLEAQVEALIGDVEMPGMGGSEALIDPLLNQLRFYPDGPVSIGDSWTIDTEMDMGLPLQIAATYTLDGVEAGIATLSIDVDLDSEGVPMELGQGITAEAFLSGSHTGMMTLDLESGMTQTMEQSGSIEGFAEFAPPGQDMVEMDMAIESESSFQSERVYDDSDE